MEEIVEGFIEIHDQAFEPFEEGGFHRKIMAEASTPQRNSCIAMSLASFAFKDGDDARMDFTTDSKMDMNTMSPNPKTT